MGFEPTPTFVDQNTQPDWQVGRNTLESGALDHSAMLTYTIRVLIIWYIFVYNVLPIHYITHHIVIRKSTLPSIMNIKYVTKADTSSDYLFELNMTRFSSIDRAFAQHVRGTVFDHQSELFRLCISSSITGLSCFFSKALLFYTSVGLYLACLKSLQKDRIKTNYLRNM